MTVAKDPESAALPEPFPGEHPFAPYVRILGKGKRGSRSFTRAEARHAMGMVLDGQVEPTQLGAMLMLLRVKEETGEELAGFADAVRERSQAPKDLKVDLDWSSYAGKRRHSPWFLFSLLLLAQAGVRVFIHGAEGHTASRVYLSEAMDYFGLPVARSWNDVRQQLDEQCFAYMPLQHFSPVLAEIIELRPILGLRSPVHSLSRLINPLDAPCVLQGIFHPPYAPLHQEAGLLLGYRRLAVIRGEGGEIERNPDNDLKVFQARQHTDEAGESKGERQEEIWKGLFGRRHVKPEAPSIEAMLGVWEGSAEDEYGVAAVISTAALALYECGRASTHDEALTLAEALWTGRQRDRFGAIALSAATART